MGFLKWRSSPGSTRSLLLIMTLLFQAQTSLSATFPTSSDDSSNTEIHRHGTLRRTYDQDSKYYNKPSGKNKAKYRKHSDPSKCGAKSIGLTKPCRINYMDNLMDYAGPDTMEAMFPGLFNQITFSVLVGVPGNHRSISHMITVLLSTMWDVSMPNMQFHLRYKKQLMQSNMQNVVMDRIQEMEERKKRQGGKNNQQDDGESGNGIVNPQPPRDPFGGGNPGPPGNFQPPGNSQPPGDPSGGGNTRSLQGSQMLDFYHSNTMSEMMGRDNRMVIWRYNISFAGYWRENSVPINVDEMNTITDSLTTMTNSSERFIRRTLKNMTDQSVSFGLSMEDFSSSDDEGTEDGNGTTSSPPTTAPTNGAGRGGGDAQSPVFGNETAGSATEQVITPLQVDWDAQRIYGVVLFSVTLIVASTLVSLSARRQELRNQSMMWSNLTSPEGVNELLETGWKINDGKMEVFDKAQWGYSDDESIFLGGFQQTETPVGTEISVTVPVTDSSRTLPVTDSSRTLPESPDSSRTFPPNVPSFGSQSIS